ncbi:MAG TPA: IMP dehydrogenase [Anaerolineales bacterium]|nr:IMP dehydrogenase [Anaerolineales bacterium]HNB86045.1 IMP dehydrogenase [Anaerolineales bacterium]HNC88027.1 IMP dehydrogenase [Anaerolineales bacterium]HND91100.1 IMP dehydrogenase [Anaerolineales bacterium]HNH03641.1 IMP dehydrogenase [Anaerolineales bacterium]
MKILQDTALTYDDVLLVPQYSDVDSRRKLSTQTKLTKEITLQIPIVSANMDVVTESEMAIAMAREGGIGIIHRFLSIDEQARQIQRVKKAESFIVDNPISMSTAHTVGDIKKLVDETGAGGILILDAEEKLVGIVTTRDLLFENDDKKSVTDLMQKKVITASPDISLKEAEGLLHEHRIEKLPLVNADGRVAGLVTLKDIMKITQYPKATKDSRGRLIVGAAVGVRDKEMRRVESALKAGADCIVVDIAHGDSNLEIDMIKNIRKHFPAAQIIGGNVATADGTKRLIDAGVDAVKVGVGPGSICITRMVAGSGVPQLTAVIECAEAARSAGIPIIADGGIRQPGDVAKAIAAGAQTVMIGSMLAGTDESPGMVMTRRGHRYKASRGMASREANIDRNRKEGNDLTQEEIEEYVAEGVEAAVPYRGRAREVLTQLVGGLQSGMSYSGAHNFEEFQKKAIFVRMTGAGLKESGPHDVEVLG